MLPLVNAKYLAKAVFCSFGISENNNNQMAIAFEIVEPAEHAGETISWLGFFTDKTTERTIESLQHLGWKGDDLCELEELDDVACARVLPEQVSIVCEPEEYNGNMRLRVKWVNKPGAGRLTFRQPLTGQGLKAFAAQMRGTIRAAQQSGGAPRQPPAQQRQAQPQWSQPQPQQPNGGRAQQRHPNAPPDDDIPF
jgi:hypothetical protein